MLSDAAGACKPPRRLPRLAGLQKGLQDPMPHARVSARGGSTTRCRRPSAIWRNGDYVCRSCGCAIRVVANGLHPYVRHAPLRAGRRPSCEVILIGVPKWSKRIPVSDDG
jgi:hypothetical protein